MGDLHLSGHTWATAQIRKHGKDRYPSPVQQFYKIMDELRELGEALERSRTSYVVQATPEVRREYADVGLAYFELGNKLGLDALECIAEVVESDERRFT